jgi:pyruvate dehydrogenase E2 component (dihydrolipoamide acetyltransferase)
VVLVVESDKADMDVESFEEGYIAKIFTPEGGSAAVGSIVAQLVDTKEEIATIGSGPASPAAVVKETAAAPAAPAASAATPNVAFESVFMPALSSTMKEGKIVAWSKKVGDKVSSGDMVLVVESDKADMDVESFEEGYLAAILVKDGESAAVGAPVAYLAKTAADIPGIQAFVSSGGSGSAPVAATTPVASSSTSSTIPTSSAAPAAVVNTGRVVATGYAQALAKEQNIDLRTVVSPRPDGLITSVDLSSGSVGAPSAYIPTPGTINATPMARKIAAENNLQIANIKGTGNFGRVTQDDVLIAAGKKVVKVEAPKVTAPAPTAAAAPGGKDSKEKVAAVMDGVVAMDGMQKAVAKNMERTLSVPIFRVSRYVTHYSHAWTFIF